MDTTNPKSKAIESKQRDEVQKRLYKCRSALKCSECENEDLTVSIGFDGFTSHQYDLHIYCNNCGTVNEIARLTSDLSKFVIVKEKPNERLIERKVHEKINDNMEVDLNNDSDDWDMER